MANCSSFNSFPSATLNWYINGQVAPPRLLVPYNVTSSKLQLYTSTLGLRSEYSPVFCAEMIARTCSIIMKYVCERLSQIVNLLFIRLKVEKNLFSKTGDLKIKCTATIDPIYWKSNEESIQGFQERSYINFWNSGNLYNDFKDTISSSL